MDEMMNSVSVQIQRAINEAISSQILPQIQNAVMAGSGQLTKERWNVPAERPEGYSEVLQNLEPRNNSKSKQANDRLKDGFTSTNSRAYDTYNTERIVVNYFPPIFHMANKIFKSTELFFTKFVMFQFYT